MPLVQANGVEIYCEVHGEGHPVLLVMGINAQLIHWPPEMIERLVEAGFKVIAFDNRDMGQSTWFDGLKAPSLGSMIAHRLVNRSQETPYKLSDMAEDGFGVLTALGIDSAHIIGASMGGMIAQQMAILHPERVRSLTSIMSHTGERRHFMSDPRALLPLMGTTPANAEEAGERVVGLMKVIGSPSGRRPDEHYRWLGSTAYQRGSNPQGFKRQLAAIVTSGSRDAQLKQLTVPTAVIHGTADPLVPPWGGRHTASVIPNAELVLIDGMGHDLPVPKLDTIIAAFRRAAGV